jgi:transposase
VENRAVPADNNRAERELRPTVIARKVSFGSQSDAGAKTREVLMSVVHTLAKRVPDPEAHFKAVLDQLAADPTQDPRYFAA